MADGGEATMESRGFYNRHSTLQAAAAAMATSWLVEAADEVPLPEGAGASITVADFGAAQGHNSMPPLTEAVGALRRRTDVPIQVVHTDLPGNDFTSIFEAVAHDELSYLHGHPEVFPYCIGRSFYSRLFPRGSVQLGWSATTTHWLSERPARIRGHLNAADAPPAERSAFSARAAEDWAEFLWNRAAELVPGGRMVMVEPCSSPDGTLGAVNTSGLMDEIIAELVDEQRLTEEQALDMTLPTYLRTPDEYLAPLDESGSVRLVRSELVDEAPNPMLEHFEATGDARTYARDMAGSTRGWAGHMLFGALPPEQADVEDEFFRRFRAKGEADPERLHQVVHNVLMEFERPAT
jgi:hypothetical protein